MKSSKQFCLVASRPAWCHSCAVLAAAPDVRDHDDPAALEPQHQLGIELRHQRDRIPAVRRQQCRRRAVPRSAGRGDDVERDTGAVPRRRELARHLVPGQVDRTGGRQGRRSWHLPVGRYPPGGWLDERLARPGNPVRAQLGEACRVRRHRADRRDLRGRLGPAVEIERPQLLGSAVHVGDPDRASGHHEVLDDQATRRHDLVVRPPRLRPPSAAAAGSCRAGRRVGTAGTRRRCRARHAGSCRGCPPAATTHRRSPGGAGRSATRRRHPSAPCPSASGRRGTWTGRSPR